MIRTNLVERRLDAEGIDALALSGVNDRNLRELNRLLDVRVVLRGETVIISGEDRGVSAAVPVVRRVVERARLRRPVNERILAALVAAAAGDGERRGGDADSDGSRDGLVRDDLRIALPGSKRAIVPKSKGQRNYVQAIRDHEVAVGIGPAGTGKTYLAVACAVEALARRRVKRIILARPAVEAGENLGFLPGDLQEKVNPFLRPLYDALGDMMPRDRIARALEDSTIEIAPLAYMRGRTLADAFVILDEAQNATTGQMKMLLTRLGVNSRVVITGDKTQTDLPRRSDSGLLEVERVLAGIEGVALVYLEPRDVIRHRLVKEILLAYARDDAGGHGSS